MKGQNGTSISFLSGMQIMSTGQNAILHIHVRTLQDKEYFELDQTLESVTGLFKLYYTGQRFPISGILVDRDDISKIRIFKTELRDNEILGARVWDIGIDVTRELMIKSRESVDSRKTSQTSAKYDKISAAMENFAAFFHTVWGTAKVERLYGSVFTEDELKRLGKAEKIRKILETHQGNLRIVLRRIIDLHKEYSKQNIKELRTIVRDFDLSLKEAAQLSLYMSRSSPMHWITPALRLRISRVPSF